MFNLATDIGVDLGTASVLIYVKGKGVVLREPSVLAVDTHTNRVLAIGEEARRMLGRTPGTIRAIRPLKDGVIADYDITELMLKEFLGRVAGRRLFYRPRIMVCVPSGVTTVEKRAVIEATLQAGARATYLIEEPLAAALGAGLDISEPGGNMVVDVGGGTTDIAVLSLGGIVLSRSLRVGGDKFDAAIVRYVKRKHNVMIGDRTAEELKITAATASARGRDCAVEAKGRDLLTGLPKEVRLTSQDLREALAEPLREILDGIRSVLEATPPELAADIMERGMVLTGGGALLHGLDELIAHETGVLVHLAEDPLSCVALGTGVALENLELYEPQLVYRR